MDLRRFTRGRRKWVLIAACIILPPFLLAGYARIHCARNAAVNESWDAYVARWRAATPPVSNAPGSDLVAFQDTSRTVAGRGGLRLSPWGYKRPDGSIAIAAEYDQVQKYFSEGLAWARTPQQHRELILRPDGSEAFDLGFDFTNRTSYSGFSSGRARVRVRIPNGWLRDGYIDTQGNLVIPARYVHAEHFEGDYALVHGTTWLTPICERIAISASFYLGRCLAEEAYIIDRFGNRVPVSQLP